VSPIDVVGTTDENNYYGFDLSPELYTENEQNYLPMMRAALAGAKMAEGTWLPAPIPWRQRQIIVPNTSITTDFVPAIQSSIQIQSRSGGCSGCGRKKRN
jgi:hypothetical protein